MTPVSPKSAPSSRPGAIATLGPSIVIKGDLTGEEMLDARITLDLPAADLRYEQEGTIALS